jgi:hypothetical protein
MSPASEEEDPDADRVSTIPTTQRPISYIFFFGSSGERFIRNSSISPHKIIPRIVNDLLSPPPPPPNAGGSSVHWTSVFI